jgi:hypothetical protein
MGRFYSLENQYIFILTIDIFSRKFKQRFNKYINGRASYVSSSSFF